MATARISLPEKLIPVFSGEADVRGAYGGRGSGKTRSFATMAAVRGYMFGNAGITGQILCCRQFMNSLEDSSLEECKRAIEDEPFLADWYEIGEKYIRSKCGRIHFSFAGLDRNIASIKSKGRILLCWVDEAEPVTDGAWKTLEPTLREEGDGWNAELWVTWNPQRKGSATDLRFRYTKDPRVKVVQLNWRDNPKFPAILERKRLKDLEERPEDYDHIWEGAYGTTKGSILGRWVNLAEREGRINDGVEYDPNGRPVEISCDLGFRDTAAWWFWQRKLGGFSVFHFDQDTGLDAFDWADRIDKILKDYDAKLGTIWLPHDARAKTFQSKHTTAERFISFFGSEHIRVVPQSKKLDQISAARAVIGRCEFNKTMCESGLDGLREWEFEFNEQSGAYSREPLHNWASHPSDAFGYGCQVMQEDTLDEQKPDNVRGITVGANEVTLNELWDRMPTATRTRI